MVWHGGIFYLFPHWWPLWSPFDNSVEFVFGFFLKYWEWNPTVVLAHQQKVIRRRRGVQPQNAILLWQQKKVQRNKPQTISPQRTTWISIMDIHGVTQRLQSQTMQLLPKWRQQPQLRMIMETTWKKCMNGKPCKPFSSLIRQTRDQHQGHSTGCAARLPQRGKATIWFYAHLEHFASVLSLTIELSFKTPKYT